MFGSDPLEELVIPDGTHVKEHDLVAEGDVLVGGQSVVELGIRGGAVVAGERVTIEGDVEADGDCRLDMWCDVAGNVLVGSDAYLGERVHIGGQLIVSGDLDIGDDVDIEEGFEANGWIVIRNPMPTIVFLFVYLSHLLRIGEEEAAEAVATEFLSEDSEAEPVRIPRGARVSDDAWRVSTDATIGDECRLHGNIRAAEIDVGTDTEVFGSLRAKGPIRVGSGTVVHGDVTTRGGRVVVDPGVHVRGDISCDRCELSEAAEVEGTIRAREGISIEDAPTGEAVRPATAEDAPKSGESDPEAESEPNAEATTDRSDEADEAATAEESDRSDARAEPAPPTSDPDSAPDSSLESDPSPAPETDPELESVPDRAFVPLDEESAVSPDASPRSAASRDPAPEPAIVPIADSSFEWEAVPDRSRNGTVGDVAAIIADAEEE